MNQWRVHPTDNPATGAAVATDVDPTGTGAAVDPEALAAAAGERGAVRADRLRAVELRQVELRAVANPEEATEEPTTGASRSEAT